MTKADVEARIAAFPVTGSPAEMRRAFAKLANGPDLGRLETRSGICALVFGEGRPVIWLHGGGYVFGSPETHAAPAAFLAHVAGVQVWVPSYRRAPEGSWPAPLEDACTFLECFDGSVPLVGDSAGGHLALNVARHRPGKVSALALISPNTDRTGQSTTRARNSDSDAMNDDEDDASLSRMAMPGLSDEDWDVSPLVSDLGQLPPTLVTASTDEVLLDDALLLIGALARAGVPVEADIIRGLFHMWVLWPEDLVQARDTLSQIALFLNRSDVVSKR